MTCCGACKHWTPTEAKAIVFGGTREQRRAAESHAEESGLCTVFIARYGEAYDWLRSRHGPFWGSQPGLDYLTHPDDGSDCAAFEKIDA
jgi:hypothetical protein